MIECGYCGLILLVILLPLLPMYFVHEYIMDKQGECQICKKLGRK